MSELPLIPSAVYGLRTWRPLDGPDGERLGAPQGHGPWPAGGAWLEAACALGGEHAAPDPGCTCGIHAWHPRPASARTVLAGRRDVAGVVEASGAVELHEEGFRAARARPYALFVLRGRNARLIERLAAVHEARVVAVSGPDDVLAWCAGHGLGLSEDAVAELLGPETLAAAREQHHRERRRGAVRLAAAVVIGVALLAAGLGLAKDPPGDRTLFGRSGKVHVHRP